VRIKRIDGDKNNFVYNAHILHELLNSDLQTVPEERVRGSWLQPYLRNTCHLN